MRVRTTVILSAVILAGTAGAFVAAGPGLAHAQPDPLVRVNVSTGGREANAGTRPGVGISESGQFVVFSSYADNLVPVFPPPPSGVADIFIRDMTAGTTDLVSVDSLGAPSTADSDSPSASSDGQRIVFVTVASLIPDDTNSLADVYLRDRSSGTTTLVSRHTGGPVGDGPSWQPMISADGSHVVFASDATNLVASDTNRRTDIFVAEVQTGSVDRVNRPLIAVEADDDSAEPAISSDGRYVVFSSAATNLVPADANNAEDVFFVDRDAGGIERVSVWGTNIFRPDEFDGWSGSPSVNADGRLVVFETAADLSRHTHDTNNTSDIVLRHMTTGLIELVSADKWGHTTGNGASRYPRISAHGWVVTFESAAENLDFESGNGYVDVFRWGSGSPVSMRNGFIDANGASHRPVVDGTGSRIAFTTAADNLVSDDCNGAVDVLVSDENGERTDFQPCGPPEAPR
jgi:Tol biopolymer transport system component